MAGHVAPEAAVGGPIAFVEEGDQIVFDVDARRLDLDVPEAVLARRRERWAPPAPPYTSGVLAKYAALVSSASEGAITQPPR
jgi:dihydroxy-acid dehydratase